jgi:hypothetical protein
MLAPEWGLLVMPGVRYELSRSVGPEKRHYFDELFVGPQDVYERSYDTKGTLTGIHHYLFTTLSWTVRAY